MNTEKTKRKSIVEKESTEIIKLEGGSRMHVSSPNATVIMGCELSIALTVSQLNECLRKLCKAYPLIHKIVTINERNEAILTDEETTHYDILEYENLPYEIITEIHLKDEWKLGGSFAKFIINHLENGCQLIISCNHAICDGLSLVHLLEDIAAYFQNGSVPDEETPVQLHPYNMQKQHAAWPYKLLALVMSSKWKKHSIKLSQEMLSNIYKAYWEKHDAKIVSMNFNSEQTQKIIDNAKGCGVTVNTFLTYLLYKSQLNLPSKPFRDEVIISVNLRDKLTINPQRQLGFFVTGIRMNLSKFSDGKLSSLKDLQATIKSKLSSKLLYRSLALYFFAPSFFDLIQLNKFNLRQDKSLQKIVSKQSLGVNTAFALTNLGVIKPNIKCANTLTKFLPLAFVSDTMEKYVSVFTHNGKMQLTVCYDPTIVSEKEITKFKNLLKDELKITAGNV